MRIELLSVARLNPAPYNPRLELKPGDAAWKKLERSLLEFDLVQPIVWNERTGHVVSGHQRLAVLKHHGASDVDCVVVDLPLEKEQALNITLNNASVASDWDPGKLVTLVSELQALPEFDATLTGFDAQQLNDLVFAPQDILPPDPESASVREGIVKAILNVPQECWEQAESHLNDLLAECPTVTLHVREPGE